MKTRDVRAYKIEIFGLSNGSHNFDFDFDDDFFSFFENSLISKGKGSCEVLLSKTDSMITLHLTIEGSIELECDRSLDLFDYPVSTQKELIYKYGDEEKELSEDVFVILKGEQELNIAKDLYECISLEIPMKKLHPRYAEDLDEIVTFSTEETDSEETADPRWEALKNLKK